MDVNTTQLDSSTIQELIQTIMTQDDAGEGCSWLKVWKRRQSPTVSRKTCLLMMVIMASLTPLKNTTVGLKVQTFEFSSSVMMGWDSKDSKFTPRTRVSYVRPKGTRSGDYFIILCATCMRSHSVTPPLDLILPRT